MAIAARAAHFEDDAEWNDVWAAFDARPTVTRRSGDRTAQRPRSVLHHSGPTLRLAATAAATARTTGLAPVRTADAGAGGGATPRETGRSDVSPSVASRPVEGDVRTRARRRLGRAVFGAVASALVLAGLWAALPYALAARMTATLRTGDAAALSRQMESAGTGAGLRTALEAEVPDWMTGGARRYVEAMAERMAARAEANGAAARMVGLRATLGEGGALPRPDVLRSATALGPAAFRLEYGPEQGAGGLSFDLAWRGTEFRVVSLRVMDPPPRPAPVTVIAMR